MTASGRFYIDKEIMFNTNDGKQYPYHCIKTLHNCVFDNICFLKSIKY